MKRRDAMTAATRFFYLNAGCSYNPKTETQEQGKQRGARALARAERQAVVKGFSYSWSVDPDIDSTSWLRSDEDGGKDNRPWRLWQCAMYNSDGRIVASLHGIDFGRDGEPWGDSYKRVVEAELATEGLTNDPQ